MSKTSKSVLMIVSLILLVSSICGLTSCFFEKKPQPCALVIDEAIANGKVAADKEAYVEGETVILTITRSAGYELVSIKLNGVEKISEVSSDGRRLEFVIEADTSITAEFAKIATYRLDISVLGGGNVVSDKSVYLTGNTAVLTIAPSAYHRLSSITVDGVEKKDEVVEKDGRQTLSFVVSSNAVVVAVFEEMPPEDLLVTVTSRVNLDNMVLTLTDPEGNSQKVMVVEGKFTVPGAEQGTVYTVSGESRGFEISLGTFLADGNAVQFDPASYMTDNSGTLDIAGGCYVVSPEYHKGINLIPVAPIEGDSWFVTKIQIAPEDMAALLASTDEIVAGISLKSGDQTSVEHMIQLKPGDNVSSIVCGSDRSQGGSDVWDYDGSRKDLFFSKGDNKVLTAEGQALAGDGLYFIVHYDADSGMTYTYWGSSLENIVKLREWGNGAGHAFKAESPITGMSIGYVHTTWGTRPPYKLTFSEVGRGATLVEALHLPEVTLKEGNSFEHGSVYVEGKPYGDVVLTFIPDEDYGVGSVTVNGVPMSPDAEGKLVLSNYKQLTVDVVALFNNNKFAVSKSESANVTLSIKDGNGNELDAEALARVQFGTILTVEAIPADGYMIKVGSFTIGGAAQTSNKVNYTVIGDTLIAAEAEACAHLSGNLNTEHYDEYLDSVEVYAQSAGSDLKLAGTISDGKWYVTVPADYSNFEIVIHDATGRFHEIRIAMENTSSAIADTALIPVMTKYDVWTGTHNGSHVPDQNKLVLNADGSYSIVKTESGAALHNDNWWASGVATGATFAGVSSKYWVMETEIVLTAAGGWNQWHAGLMVDEKEFIMIMDRDWQLAAWTEWDLAAGASGSWTDLISDSKAAAAGIVSSSNFAPEGRPIKITAVRDNADMYIFLNDIFVGKYAISSKLFPNTSRGESKNIGFMVKSGTQATFDNFWYEQGEANVDAYLAAKKAGAPELSVKDANGATIDGATVQYYKEVLIKTDNANGYKETVEWQLATDEDMYAGAILKAVISPAKLDEGVAIVGGLKYNGVSVSMTENAYTFTLGKGDKLDVDVVISTPINAIITVDDRVNLDGMTLTLVNAADDKDVCNATVADKKFALNDVAKGATYRVYADIAGIDMALGAVTVSSEALTWNPVGAITSGSGSVDLAGNTYTVKGSETGRVDFNALAGSIPAGDVYVGTKIQISAEDLNTLLTDTSKEAVFGIEMRAGDHAVENMLRIQNGDIQLLCGEWTEGGKFFTDGALNDLGNALKGEGVYLVMHYQASSGMVFTYLGASLDSLTCIRNWHTGSDQPGNRSFAANSQITGFSFGYVHTWVGNNKVDVTFSDAFVSRTLAGLQNKDVLLDMEKATLKWQSTGNTLNDVGYQNAKGTLSYDADAGVGKYTFPTIATHATKPYGKTFVPYFQGFDITDISAYSTITLRVKIDASTCSEGFALTVRPFNKTAAATQRIVAGEWVELTFNIADFTHAWDTTVSGYLATVNKASLTNLGLVFMVEDTASVTMEPGFTMYISDFVLE